MPPKKAAKKAPGHHDPHKPAKDARRTFEHLGRVQALASLTSAEDPSLRLLTQTADAAYRVQQYKDSADLLRAAEHLSFACLHRSATETVSNDLKDNLNEEFEHLMERAKEHTSHDAVPKSLLGLLAHLSHEAKSAMQRGSYRAAMEYARGAEALSHVHAIDLSLPAPATQKYLRN